MAMRAVTLGAAMTTLLGCVEPTSELGESSSSTPPTTTTAASTDGSGSTTGDSTAGTSSGVEGSSGNDDAADSGSDTGNTSVDPTDTGMPLPPKLCSLEAVHDGDGPVMMLDAGDGPGQIPTLVGEVLLRNCGCHYTDDIVPGAYVDYKSNDAPMNTHADFHALFAGTFPQNYEDMPMYLAVEQRVVHSNPLPMPPFVCGIEGGEPGQRISSADLELLTQWLAAAAPDGASFP